MVKNKMSRFFMVHCVHCWPIHFHTLYDVSFKCPRQ